LVAQFEKHIPHETQAGMKKSSFTARLKRAPFQSKI
jgi:hypothetical protein